MIRKRAPGRTGWRGRWTDTRQPSRGLYVGGRACRDHVGKTGVRVPPARRHGSSRQRRISVPGGTTRPDTRLAGPCVLFPVRNAWRVSGAPRIQARIVLSTPPFHPGNRPPGHPQRTAGPPLIPGHKIRSQNQTPFTRAHFCLLNVNKHSYAIQQHTDIITY